ncbi:PBSX family phage terminase large subunit [Thermoanaerobacterium sp. CMT5567-10]|uniref:PBSX family phage terminase large subunit n=1 Tax=Thermoanaerobacterium sp. CMT5567-10 TaxID=3061989 RepID=UPI0026DEA788|nr:PBSX family phage terminase large subunit [Thermoanaerobacterium sp. CMT5567-10]WKV08187.1 PBSX family phage terminase large subunit [Thermoanaerobacterium sp. CMT5567-10]
MMKINLTVNKNIFNEAYLPYLETEQRFNIFYGGAGSGKSVFVVQKMILKYLKMPKRKCLVIRKVAATLRDSIFAEFINQLENTYKILEYCTVTESRLAIKLPNGSLFLFKGLDNPEKIKSIQGVDDIIIEEASELTLDDFSQLNLRLRSKAPNQQIHLMFNPISKGNWTYHRFFENGLPDDTLIVHTTWKDNRFLPDEYIKELLKMKEINPTYYKIYALGLFATLDKLIYTNIEIKDFDWTKLKYIKKFGLDFGYTNDPTAFSCSLMNLPERLIYIFDEHYQTGMLNNHIANMIKAKGFQNEIIRADSAEPKSIAEIRSYGIPRILSAKKGPDSILNGIQKLQQFKIIVHPNCKKHILEFENYTWKKDKNTNEFINEPIDEFNHLMDALRYAYSDVTEVFDRKNYSGKGARQ